MAEMESKAQLGEEYAEKEKHHHDDHLKAEQMKNATVLDKRPERHSGTGHAINEGPKKEGSGKGNWGTYKDDIEEAKEEGLM